MSRRSKDQILQRRSDDAFAAYLTHPRRDRACSQRCTATAQIGRLFRKGKPTACFVDRVHLGSRIGIVIDYSVQVTDANGSISEVRIFGQLPWIDVDAAAERAERKLARLQHSEFDGGDETPNVLQIPEWGLLLRRPAQDERICGLWLLKPRKQWSRHVVDDEAAELSRRFDRATLLTHRFAKRAVLRLHNGRAPECPPTAILKLYRRATSAAQTSANLHRILGDGAFPTRKRRRRSAR